MEDVIELEYETCFHCGDRFIRKRGSTLIACELCIEKYLDSLKRLEVSYA